MEENKTLVGQNVEATNQAEPEKKNEGEREPITFDVEPIQFESDAGTFYANTVQLREKIDGMFRSVYTDYEGCRIDFNDGMKPEIINRSIPVGCVYVDLVFREKGAEGFHMLERRSKVKGKSRFDQLEFTLGGMNNRAYTLMPDSVEALEEFLPTPMGNPKNRKKLTVDQWVQQRTIESPVTSPAGSLMYGYTSSSFIDVSIIGFPIENFLRKLYGVKDADGKMYEYACHLLRRTWDGKDLVLQITRMDMAVVNKLYTIVGVPNTNFQTSGTYAGLFDPYNGIAR